MTTTPTSGAAIQRYKIGYHADEWGQRSSTPSGIPDASGSWVRYADHVTALAAGQATAAKQPDSENLRKALQFYADSEHFIKADDTAWDTVSGEPQNYWCDEAGTATVEDGHIARLALSGHLVRFEDDAAQPAVQQGVAYAALPEKYYLAGGEVPTWDAKQMRAFADATHTLRASQGQAPAGAALPESWVPLMLTHEGQYPEEVAYGPLIMMDRLGKWLGKYFDQAAQADSVQEDAARLEVESLKAQLHAADLPEALRRSTAADGKTELFNLPGCPLMVRAVDFNRVHTESEMCRAALLDEMQKAALAAGQATAAQAVVPAGWKLVPLDATDEMVRATDEVNFENGDTDGTIHNVWHVMIAAAPAQPAAQHGVAYAALPESFLEIPDVQDESGINAYYSREAVLECIDAALASHVEAPADAAPSAGAVTGPDDIDAIALTRYKVVHSHDSMFHRFAVVAGDGKQQLYLGRETECQNMTRKFAGAFLDGAFYQSQIAAAPTPAAQAADSVPAEEREQERIAFKDAHRHLELDEVPDAWGRPMFKHSHIEASWLGWIARASHGQAPAAPKGDIDD